MNLNPRLDIFGPAVPLWERGQAGGRSRPINADASFRNALAVKQVFDDLGIRFCLSHGTILGVLRDGDVIAHDDDVDLALFSEDRPKLEPARRRLRALGFFVPDEGDPTRPIEPHGPNANMPYYDFVAIRDGEKIEGWIFDQIGDFYIYDQTRDGLTIPRRHLDTFSEIPWRGVLFKAPHDVDGYLDLMYGKNWRTPDPDKKYNPLRPSDFVS